MGNSTIGASVSQTAPGSGSGTATTQPTYDNSTKVATTAFVNSAIVLSMAYLPLNVTGGIVSFASQGTGCRVYIHTTGGVIDSITTIVNAGTGYKV